MEKTELEKQELLKELWYRRNPCHDRDSNGVDRFWRTALLVFEEYQKALTIPVVVKSLPNDYDLGTKLNKYVLEKSLDTESVYTETDAYIDVYKLAKKELNQIK